LLPAHLNIGKLGECGVGSLGIEREIFL